MHERYYDFFAAGAGVLFAVVWQGCSDQSSTTTQTNSQKVPSMSDFEYLACDGGPHLVLPKESCRQWKGAGSVLAVLSKSSDYGRGCAAVATARMALITVGSGQAIVMANPPLSAWGRSPEGWTDIYDLQAWADTNTDALLKRAVSATPTGAMSDTGKLIKLSEAGLILLFAGDRPGNTAYGEHAVPIAPGTYRILEGHYKAGTNEEVYIYRLCPKDS